jgi:hypothetical protein
MTEGLSPVLDDVRPARPHRLEANVQPGNEASIRLVARLGFVAKFAAIPEDPGTARPRALGNPGRRMKMPADDRGPFRHPAPAPSLRRPLSAV